MNNLPYQVKDMITQLGGARTLDLMLGLKQISYGKDQNENHMLIVKFKAKATNKSNCLRVTLEPSDTYKVDFIRIHGHNVKTITSHEGIYNDMLKGLFSKETGLDLIPPRFA